MNKSKKNSLPFLAMLLFMCMSIFMVRDTFADPQECANPDKKVCPPDTYERAGKCLFTQEKMKQLKMKMSATVPKEAAWNYFLKNNCKGESKVEVAWSEPMGAMNWNDAKSTCASKKMRLPTIEEFKKVFESESFKGWTEVQKGDFTFWTSKEDSPDLASHFFFGYDGPSYVSYKTESRNIRCIR